MFKNTIIKQFSESGILIKFQQKPSRELILLMTHLQSKLKSIYAELILDVNFTYNSLLITYAFTIKDVYTRKLEISALLESLKNIEKLEFRKILLPVCYDGQFGIDMPYLSEALHLDKSEIIRLHSSTEYLVCFLGFLPGFPYLENLPKQLHCPRKKTPRPKIEKGAVGIGGSQTGIYPQESPGGWQIIGNCPIDLFGNNLKEKALLKSTDILQFQSVTLEEYHTIKSKVENGTYKLNTKLVAAS